MNQDNLAKLPSNVVEALTRFTATPDIGLRDFLVGEVGEAAAATITSVVDQIQRRTEEVGQARSEGQSAAYWLGGVLDQVDALPVLRSVPGLLAKGEDSSVNAARALLTGGALGLGGVEAASGAVDAVLDAVAPVQELAESFLKTPLGDAVEAGVISVASAAAVKLAEAAGTTAATAGIVANVDLGLRIAKVGYKLATGDLDSFEAADLIEDRLAAGLATLAGEAVEQGAEVAARWLGAALDGFLGTPGVMSKVGETIGAMAGRAVRPLVEQGTEKLTRHLWRSAKTLAQQATKRVGAWAGKLAAGLLG